MSKGINFVCVGFVNTNEYDWKAGMLQTKKLVETGGDIELKFDAGKVLGVAQHALDLEEELSEMEKELASSSFYLGAMLGLSICAPVGEHWKEREKDSEGAVEMETLPPWEELVEKILGACRHYKGNGKCRHRHTCTGCDWKREALEGIQELFVKSKSEEKKDDTANPI